MSGTRFVPRTEAEVRDTLEPAGFKQVKIDGTHEMVFERPTDNKNVRIRVYTTIVSGLGGSATRLAGADAGRVVLVVNGSNRPVWKAKRVHRTQNFLVNLLERCREAFRAVSSLKSCPKCGAAMVPRRSARGKFWGCLCYPVCRGTRSA